MMRTILVAVLLAQSLAVPSPRPEDSPGPEDSPRPDWEYRLLQTAFEARQRNQRLLAANPAPSEEIAARMALESNAAGLRAARRLLTADGVELAKGIRLLNERSYAFHDDGTSIQRELQELVGALRTRLAALTAEEGADAARWFLYLEEAVDPNPDAAKQRQAAFLARYAGTTAAIELQLYEEANRREGPRDESSYVRRLRAFIRASGNTASAARAWQSIGFRQGSAGIPETDASGRMLDVFEAVKQLESGRFPKCDAVEQAPKLVVGIFVGSEPRIAVAARPRLYAEYLDFIVTHPGLRADHPLEDAIAWVIKNAVSQLAPGKDQRIATVERFLADLETRGFGANATRYQRAMFYQSLIDYQSASSGDPKIDPMEAERRARQALLQIRDSGDAVWQTRAIAMLAAFEFVHGHYQEAQAAYTAYLQHYPGTDWAWVTALRAAQSRETRGDIAGAVTDYETIAARFVDRPYAVVLAHIAAGDLREAGGKLSLAAEHYRAAVAAWSDVPERLMMYLPQGESVRPPAAPLRFHNVTKEAVRAKVERISRAVTVDAALLYQGRRALEDEKPGDALQPLQQLLSKFPKSALVPEAQAVLRRARFAQALMNINQDTLASTRELEALTRAAAYDSTTTMARLAGGAWRLRSGLRGNADAITKAALTEWHARQALVRLPATPLEKDVAAIRAALFKPKGGGIYGTRGWNAFEWPVELSPFQIVARDVAVKTLDGHEQTVSATFKTPADTRVVFASTDELASLRLILDRVGGTDTMEWGPSAMDRPNQPIGGSVNIAELWSRYFPMRPGHWGGWELTIYPSIDRITFDRDAHALAEFTVGYSGGTIELVKENGAWIAKRIVSEWIT